MKLGIVVAVVTLSLFNVAAAERLQAEPKIPDLILGSEWSASCVSKDTAQRTACRQFVLGMSAAFTLWQLTEGQSPSVCIALVDTSQLIDVGRKFIRDNPRYGDIPVARVLFDAFHQAWPCH